MRHPSSLISAFLDGELSATESSQLHSHLSSCGKCSAELQDVQRVRSAIRSLPVLDLPPDLMFIGDPNVVALRRHRYVLAGAAAVIAVVMAIATIFSPTQPTVTMDDLTSRLAARVSVDPAFGPAKLMPILDPGGIQE